MRKLLINILVKGIFIFIAWQYRSLIWSGICFLAAIDVTGMAIGFLLNHLASKELRTGLCERFSKI